MSDLRRILETTGDEFERALLSAARHDDIPAQRRDLLIGALGVSAGGVAGVAVTAAVAQPAAANAALLTGPVVEGAAVGTQVVGGASLAVSKAMIAAGLGAIGVALFAAAGVWTPEAAPRAPIPAVVVPSEAPKTSARVDSNATRVVSPSEPPAPSPAVSPTPEAPSKAVAAADSLTQELELIEHARTALSRRDGAQATKELDSYARRFPSGSLRTEAKVLRIEALMLRGDRAGATRLGRAFLQRSPKGPYARRIRSLLGEGDAETNP